MGYMARYEMLTKTNALQNSEKVGKIDEKRKRREKKKRKK